jgi:hypothetical protein
MQGESQPPQQQHERALSAAMRASALDGVFGPAFVRLPAGEQESYGRGQLKPFLLRYSLIPNEHSSGAAASVRPGRVCDGCGATEAQQPPADGAAAAKFKRCAACRAALYCSAACQRTAWPAHKAACRAAAAAAAELAVAGAR